MYEHRILEHAMVITQRYYLSMAFIDYFYQQIGLKFEEKTNKMLHLEHGFVCAETWTLRAADQKEPGKFRNVVLEEDGEDQLDRSCEK